MNKLLAFIFFVSCILYSCSKQISISKWAEKQSPELFRAKFETTKGDFIVEFHREWSPLAVDRAYQLIQTGFYDSTSIFRVVKDYVAQFGINTDSTKNKFWNKRVLQDESVVKENLEGTLSFARGGPNTRGTQLFINLKKNSPRLDTLRYSGVSGFPVIGKIVEGNEVLGNFFSDYGNDPNQGQILENGNKYLSASFPKLDYIIRAYVIK